MDPNPNAGILFHVAGISCCQILAYAIQGARISSFFRIMNYSFSPAICRARYCRMARDLCLEDQLRTAASDPTARARRCHTRSSTADSGPSHLRHGRRGPRQLASRSLAQCVAAPRRGQGARGERDRPWPIGRSGSRSCRRGRACRWKAGWPMNGCVPAGCQAVRG